MEILPAQRIAISGLGWADYRNSPSTCPVTPLQQLLRHAAREAGRPVRLDELTLSTRDALELELRTADFIGVFVRDPKAAEVIWHRWKFDSRPRVSLALKRSEADIEQQQNPSK